MSFGAPFIISLTELYFIMIFIMLVVNIIGIFMAINYFLNYTLDFLYLSSSGSANAQLPGCFHPWTFSLNIGFNKYVTFGLLYVLFTFPARTFYRGVPGFAIDCPCCVWWRGLTTCPLYVGPLFENLVENDSWFVSLTKGKTTFCCFLLLHILIPYNRILYFCLPYFYVSNNALFSA